MVIILYLDLYPPYVFVALLPHMHFLSHFPKWKVCFRSLIQDEEERLQWLLDWKDGLSMIYLSVLEVGGIMRWCILGLSWSKTHFSDLLLCTGRHSFVLWLQHGKWMPTKLNLPPDLLCDMNSLLQSDLTLVTSLLILTGLNVAKMYLTCVQIQV